MLRLGIYLIVLAIGFEIGTIISIVRDMHQSNHSIVVQNVK